MAQIGPMRLDRRLVGLTLTLVMALAVASVGPAYAAHPGLPPQATEHRGHKMVSPFQKGMVFTITGSGTAFNITDKSKTEPASLSLKVTVDKASPGRARLTVDSGTLTITGAGTFQVTGGHGIINTHSMKVVIHAKVTDNSGKTLHLVLFGKITSSINVDTGFTIDFKMPQSKLAGKWFLEFPLVSVKKA